MYKNLPKFNDDSYVHFVTANTHNKYPYFRNEESCRILMEELEFYKNKYGFDMVGYVIMLDHLHLLFWWDKDEKRELRISKIMQGIRGATARRIIDLIQSKGLERMLQSTRGNARSRLHRRNLGYRLWQPGFYDFNIYSESKLLEKLNYMHNNPVRAALVSSPEDYEWSSCRQYCMDGLGSQGVSN